MWAARNGHTETVREMSGYSGIDMNEKDMLRRRKLMTKLLHVKSFFFG